MRRAYGSEPVLFSSSPISPAPAPPKSPKKMRRPLYAALGVCSVCLIGVVVWTVAIWHSESNPIPAGVRSAASFPLYRPAWLPGGYTIDPDSYAATAQVVTFTARNDAGKKLVFSEQPKPKGFNFETFYTDQMTGTQFVEAKAGKAAIGEFENVQSASLLTGKTWILVRAPETIDQSSFKRVVVEMQSMGD